MSVRDSEPRPDEPGLPRLTGCLRPLVELAARTRASIHAKLLAGFLTGALLLLGLGVLNLLVIDGMGRRVAELSKLQERVDRSRQMEHLVTAQSHFRGMVILTRDEKNLDKIVHAKESFRVHLEAVEHLSGPGQAEFFRKVRDAEARFTASSARTLELYRSGDYPGATQLHLDQEHPISHELEAAMGQLQANAIREMSEARTAFEADRRFLAKSAATFSVLSLALALLFGFVLSWSFVLPVRKIETVLASIASGDFARRVSVSNRDELGALGRNVNATSGRLTKLWSELRSVSDHLQAVVDNAMDGIVTIDATRTIRSFNPAAERIFGYAAADVVGRPLRLLLGEAVTEAMARDLFQPQAETLRAHREVMGRRRDGHTFPMEVAVGEMSHRDDRLLVAVVRDITERKRTQEELALARDAALDASRAKSAFVANISHELRTPLNAIIGYSELLREEVSELGEDALIPSLEKVNGAGRHLLGLINAVLDLSKIEAGKMELCLETFAVPQLVQDVTSIVQPLVAKHHNRLQVDCPESVGEMYADSTKLRQALFNLLSNACKFTKEGTVTVEVRRDVVAGADSLTFRVSDNGIGMTPEQLGRLFQPFSQAEATTSKEYGGTGLGLVLSRRFCQMMGGDITVESAPGQGTTFTIQLPSEVREGVPAA
jgi:PAS domain S-box-containing protein